MIPQQRMANSAGSLLCTSNQGRQTRKRVRFLDRAFAQELIQREKARLEEKMQALRQAYDFRKAVSDSNDAADVPGELLKKNTVKLQSDTKSDDDEEKTVDSSKHQRRPLKTNPRQVSLSAERLSELSKPRSRNGMLPSNSSRRNAIVVASPEHLKLSVPERSPRTIPQLKHLSEDEVDYLVQPKTVQEYQQLAEMTLSVPTGILKRNDRESRPVTVSGGALRQEDPSPGTKDTKSREISRQSDDYRFSKRTSSSPRKPSFKIAALGVISMKTQERNELASRSPSVRISDLFIKSLPPKHALHQKTRPAAAALDMQPDVPGGRVLRLRPRKSAWLESNMRKRPSLMSESSPDETSQTVETDRSSLDSELPRTRSNSMAFAFASPIKYHKWREKTTINVEELTKNLSKCSYLRGTEDELDTKDAFAR